MKKIAMILMILMWSPRAGAGMQSVDFHGSEYQIVSVKETRADGTLILRNGSKVKLPRNAVEDPAVYCQKNLLIYSEGGAFHVDSEGNIIGSVLILPSSGAENNLPFPAERR